MSGYLPPGHAPLKFHPLANLFPMLSDSELDDLAEDIRANGQVETVKLHRGMVLDGRNRYTACARKNLGVRSEIFEGSEREALNWVISKNLKRRHLDSSQRAMIAAKIATMKLGDNQHSIEGRQIFRPSSDLLGVTTSAPAAPASASVSQADAAGMMNVSDRSVRSAAKVMEKGAPELQSAVETGQVAVSAAADIASLPIEEQRAIIAAADPKVVKEVSKKNRTEKQTASRQKRLDKMRNPDATPLLSGGETVGLFYVDIPREFVAWSDDTGMEKSPENHYRTEGFDFLANMRDKILARAKPDCVMVMWAWANSLQDQLDLMAEWGFASIRRRDEQGLLLRGPDGRIQPPVGEGRYRSHQIWAKRAANGNLHQGTGFWFRDCHELLLVGCRGDVPAPLEGKQALSIIDAVKGAHSEKPNDIVREMLDRYFEGVPKLEMFGRVDDRAAFKARWPLWEVWGNEAPEPEQPALALQSAEAAE